MQNLMGSSRSSGIDITLQQYNQACQMIDSGIFQFQRGQCSMAKVVLVNSAQILVPLLKQRMLPPEESLKANQYLTKALKCAEECNMKIDIMQKQLMQSNPYVKQIIETTLVRKCDVSFDQIGGLEAIKKVLNETIVLPNLRPDLFVGIRAPHKGILFYGPPGNGKTLLAKAVASQSKCCFFNISASTLVSKHLGDGEKLVRALFQTAQYFQPCVIFIDEIDSMLTARSETEHEASRRLKTEFLVCFDGMQTSDQDRIVLIGATNRPQDLDDAVQRRFTLKILIDQPDEPSRTQILKQLLEQVSYKLSDKEIQLIIRKLQGYSASDIKSVVKEASMQPLRSEITNNMILTVSKANLRQVNIDDFQYAISKIQPTLTLKQAQEYLKFDKDRKFNK